MTQHTMKKTSGFWSKEEQNLQINVLDLKTCEIALHSFCKKITDVHVRMYSDNTTSCAYINKYGGRIFSLDSIARRIWFWCIERNNNLTATHIPGKINIETDRLSRTGNDDLEWALDQTIFNMLHEKFPDMSIDLFASRLNAKLQSYVSRYPEPHAFDVGAFSFQWNTDVLY